MDPFSIASAFLMHTGARNIQLDLTNGQKVLLSHPVTKMVVLCAMFYVSTRSLVWSLVLIGVYFVTTNFLLNEKHALNIFSRSWLKEHGFLLEDKNESGMDLYLQNLAKLS